MLRTTEPPSGSTPETMVHDERLHVERATDDGTSAATAGETIVAAAGAAAERERPAGWASMSRNQRRHFKQRWG